MNLLLDAFITALTLILITEIGDKTMLLTVVYSAKHRRPLIVLTLALTALSAVTLIGIGFGYLIVELTPGIFLKYISGSLFLLLGLYYLLTPVRGEQAASSNKSLAAFFTLMFISEFGDKTQISIISLTISTLSPISVFIGALIGFTVVNSIAVILGNRLSGRLKPILIRRVSAILFIVFSILAFTGIL